LAVISPGRQGWGEVIGMRMTMGLPHDEEVAAPAERAALILRIS
jgi:hypothetical protein